MNTSEIFIRRPVMTTLVMLAILLFGIIGYRALPVSDLPSVDFPTILVSANLPGANPDTMASAVATPLERQFSTIAGLDSMTAANAQGITQITLQFSLDRDIDAAAQDVQAAISVAQTQLPKDMPSPPSYRKVNPADQPILYLSLNSPTLTLSVVDEYAETLVSERISMVNGVAQVQVFGAQKYAVRVQLDPMALATRKIGIDEVAEAVREGNVNLPVGTLWGEHQAITLQANGQLMDAQAYRPLVVTYRNGMPVRLGELGEVLDSVENNKIASWYKDRRSIVLAVQRQPGTNTIKVVDAIKGLLPALRAQIPASVNLDVLYDRSVSIRASVNDVRFTLYVALGLVVLAIFLFLRKLSATIIPSLALPISLVGTFMVMYLLDYSVDNFSLMALMLSVGFVVDDAIVMLENIVRHTEMGEDIHQAALTGSKEISFTIVSMTLSLAAVFIPVFFMGGILGRLLHEFAAVIGVAIFISGFVSLTLTPMLCSRFLRPVSIERHGKLYGFSERLFTGMFKAYEGSLKKVLQHRLAVLIFSGVLLVGTVYFFKVIPKGFLPTEDMGFIYGFTEAAQGISFEAMKEHQKEVADIIGQDPNVKAFSSSIGAGGSNISGNTGRVLIVLKPRSEGRLPIDQVIEEMRPKLATVAGIKVFLQNMPAIRIGGRLTKSLYQYTLQSPDAEELYRYAPILEAKLREAPGLQDVTSDLQITNPQVNVMIDRDKASTLGVTAQQVEDALFTAYASRQVSDILTPNNQYHVIMELAPQYQMDPSILPLLYIRSSRGALVPIESVARLSSSVGPLTINHSGQTTSVTLSFNLKPKVAISEAVETVKKLAGETLPVTITGNFQGSAQEFQRSLTGLWVLLFMAILVVYILLGILYESFIHPLTILSGLPSAGIGALMTLVLFHKELNIYAFVGIIMLIGIVKKNAIMMIDFALDAERKQGKTPSEAIYQGCLIRFRPIMMTTMAAMMGALPIALGLGAGGDARQPLGLAVVGGLVFSQVITLYITPVIYIYLEGFQSKIMNFIKRSQSRPGLD